VTPRYLGLDYLRAFLIVRLVLFHSAIAYADFGRPIAEVFAPIVDSRRWGGFAVFTHLNEVFSMSLMYFISGLFVRQALVRRGALRYALARGRRLGIPFALVVCLLFPYAFYAANLAAGINIGPLAYLKAFVANGAWAAGPLWFIWLLLVFDWCAAALHWLAPGALEELGRVIGGASRRPVRFFLGLVATAAIAYVPMVVAFGPFSWVGLGPFSVQPSRLLHYALYFFIGAGVGAYGLERGPLAPDSLLVRHWGRWSLLASLLLFFLAAGLNPVLSELRPVSPLLGVLVFGLTFVSACAASSFALLGLFQRFLNRPIEAATSLAASSYGIYLVHYFFVLWMQYFLLGAPLPAAIKALTVFACALALSWSSTALARRLWTGGGGRQRGEPAAVRTSGPRQ
jgi:hypothetical protein